MNDRVDNPDVEQLEGVDASVRRLLPTRPSRRRLLVGALALSTPAIFSARGMAQAIDTDRLAPDLSRDPAGSIDDVVRHAASLDQIHSLIVLRGGTPLIERAFHGPSLDRVANVKSVSKTLLALLTGIAIDRKAISGVDALVLPLLGRAPTGDARDRLTVGHLLSMQTGLPSTSGPRYGAWVASEDWVGYVLDAEPVDGDDREPGERFTYSTGSWHVLGALLSRATGSSLHDLTTEWLATPLDIAIPRWERDPSGLYMGGNQMALSPRSLARVGEMVRLRGRWEGAQVVSADWIDRSWQPRALSPWSGDGYGYGWFLTRIGERFAAYGRGYGGQVLAVVPDLELTIAITSDPTRPARSDGHFGELTELMRSIATGVRARSKV